MSLVLVTGDLGGLEATLHAPGTLGRDRNRTELALAVLELHRVASAVARGVLLESHPLATLAALNVDLNVVNTAREVVRIIESDPARSLELAALGVAELERDVALVVVGLGVW